MIRDCKVSLHYPNVAYAFFKIYIHNWTLWRKTPKHVRKKKNIHNISCLYASKCDSVKQQQCQQHQHTNKTKASACMPKQQGYHRLENNLTDLAWCISFDITLFAESDNRHIHQTLVLLCFSNISPWCLQKISCSKYELSLFKQISSLRAIHKLSSLSLSSY